MLPECLHRVLDTRADFLTGQPLPQSHADKPIVYLLLTGCVVLVNRNGLTTGVFWPGDLVLAPVEGAGSGMKLRAVSDSTCQAGLRADLLAESMRDMDVAHWLWEQHERRETELHRRVELLTTESVERRVLQTVADLADRCQAVSPGLPMPLAQNEIAELAGATRETTSTLLNRMRRLGMVELGRRRIQVISPDVVRALEGLGEATQGQAKAAVH